MDYQVYKELVAQTKVKSFPNKTGTARTHATWKWKHMLKKMVIPGDRIVEHGESEDTDTDSVESSPDPASMGDIGESTPDMLSPYSDIESPGPSKLSPLHTRAYGRTKSGKAKKVVYLPGDIKGLTKKLHLLAAEFFAGNTTVMYWMRCLD